MGRFQKGVIPKGAKPFKKGQSGNPKGRPRKIPELPKILANVMGKEDGRGVTEAEKVILKLLASAKKGNVRAAELILDRTFGKVKDVIDLNNRVIDVRVPDDEPVAAIVVGTQINGNGDQLA